MAGLKGFRIPATILGLFLFKDLSHGSTGIANVLYDADVPTNSSWLVSESATGLVYAGYANEGQTNAVNTVPDFSTAGYMDGGVAIPFVPAAVTVQDGPGDDTTLIQNAIDTVSGLPLGTNGFRGAVLLKAGNYTVSNTLVIAASGVVIRGEGSQPIGGTRITYTASHQSNLFEVDNGGAGPLEVSGTRKAIVDAYVPSGAARFHVSNAAGFAPGDRVIIEYNMNQQWLDDLSDMSQWGWTPSAYQLKFRRTVAAVDGNLVTLDAPLVQTLEIRYGGGDIYEYTFGDEMQNVGFEGLRMESTYAGETDEAHGWTAIKVNRLRNGWIRQVTARYFGYSLVSLVSNCRYVTVEDCAMLDPVSVITGSRRYSFYIDDSDSILMQRCLARGGRHDFVSGSQTPGPNVFVDCRAIQTYADIGPHHRYSTGQLYDNIQGGDIDVQNREDSGSGHGWAGAQIMFWNCRADAFICDAPTGAMNWCVGSVGTKGEGYWAPEEPFGIWDSHNSPVVPRSLYFAQLGDRLGSNAVSNVTLPRQKTANLWAELSDWGGDGLFQDGLVVWADEETGPAVAVPVGIRGTVRNLRLLDAGFTSVWSKVSGPGTVSFADSRALATTAVFDQPGSYVLRVAADSGETPALVDDNYEADAIGTKPSAATVVRPTSPTADISTLVVGGSTNRAGLGNAVRILDDNGSEGARLEYDLVGNTGEQISCARIDFSFAPLGTHSNGNFIAASVGECGVTQTSSSTRFLDCRLYDDGSIDFRSSRGPDSSGNALMASNNTLAIFVNDLDAEAVDYTGPDGNTHVLHTNSVAYWLNGNFVIETLMENRSTISGGVFASTNNVGRFSFATLNSAYGLDYAIDDVRISPLKEGSLAESATLAVDVSGGSLAGSLYRIWLALFPSLGSFTNLADDFEPDGMVNLAEYALGGNPVSNDASGVLPVPAVAEDGGINWLYYVYKRRVDAADRGLSYTVLTGPELMNGSVIHEVPPLGISSETNGFEAVSSRISTDAGPQAFMQLEIEWSE